MPHVYRNNSCVKQFGGFTVVRQLVAKPEFRVPAILRKLRNLMDDMDTNTPTCDDWDFMKLTPSSKFVREKLGSWENAVAEAKKLKPKKVFEISYKTIRR